MLARNSAQARVWQVRRIEVLKPVRWINLRRIQFRRQHGAAEAGLKFTTGDQIGGRTGPQAGGGFQVIRRFEVRAVVNSVEAEHRANGDERQTHRDQATECAARAVAARRAIRRTSSRR